MRFNDEVRMNRLRGAGLREAAHLPCTYYAECRQTRTHTHRWSHMIHWPSCACSW